MVKLILLILVFSFVCFICNAFRVFQVKDVETMLALEGEELRIQCRADTPMAYCGFINPAGTRFSFSGSSLDAGQCSYITNATAADSGQWRCHIGRKGSTGLEIMQIINVRIVQQLAAIQKNVTTVHGKEVTLSCTTVNGLMPLRYCRFEPPTGKPFSINSDVTKESPILDRYYFPKNKSLDRGDCAVTIHKVKYEDVGQWSCGAGLDDGKEHLDTITLDVEGLYTMSTASATGITFGAIVIAAFLVVLGFIVWKKKRFLGSMPDEGNEEEMQQLPTRSRQGSHEPSSRHESSHELPRSSHELSRSKPGSTHELARSKPGSTHELARSKPGSTHELSRSRHSVHDEPIRRIPLHGSQPLSSRRSPSIQGVPMVTVQSPSPATSPLIS